MVITTVTLNAAIDKTYYLPVFEPGKVSRAAKVIAVPGGKGLNVARVAQQLGEEVLATGFVGGLNGEFIRRELDRQGIRHDFVLIEGESRLCLNMIDQRDGTSTEVLEPGPSITAEHVEEMKRKIRQLASVSAVVSFSGSLPQGAPAHLYAELAAIAKSEGAKVFLDTSGLPLIEGVKAKPDFIKPNEEEAAKLVGRKPESDEDLYNCLRTLMEQGIECAVISLGESGSLAACGGQLYRVRAPKLNAVNTVGCGDSFVAGMAVAVSRGEPVGEALKLATACGAANALTEQAGSVRLEDVQRFLSEIVVENR